jgi:hypothetical protein
MANVTERYNKEWRLALIRANQSKALTMVASKNGASERPASAPSFEWLAYEGLPIIYEKLIELRLVMRTVSSCAAKVRGRDRSLKGVSDSLWVELVLWNESKPLAWLELAVRSLHIQLERRIARANEQTRAAKC